MAPGHNIATSHPQRAAHNYGGLGRHLGRTVHGGYPHHTYKALSDRRSPTTHPTGSPNVDPPNVDPSTPRRTTRPGLLDPPPNDGHPSTSSRLTTPTSWSIGYEEHLTVGPIDTAVLETDIGPPPTPARTAPHPDGRASFNGQRVLELAHPLWSENNGNPHVQYSQTGHGIFSNVGPRRDLGSSRHLGFDTTHTRGMALARFGSQSRHQNGPNYTPAFPVAATLRMAPVERDTVHKPSTHGPPSRTDYMGTIRPNRPRYPSRGDQT